MAISRTSAKIARPAHARLVMKHLSPSRHLRFSFGQHEQCHSATHITPGRVLYRETHPTTTSPYFGTVSRILEVSVYASRSWQTVSRHHNILGSEL